MSASRKPFDSAIDLELQGIVAAGWGQVIC